MKSLARRRDGWLNAIAGYGDASRDKRVGHLINVELFNQEAADELWRGDGMFARIVEKPPHQMTRRGWTFQIRDDKDAAEAMADRQEELKIRSKVRKCLEWQRAYGGGALLLGINDGRPMEKPVNEAGIRSLEWVTELTPRELVPVAYYKDPKGPKYGEPEIYEMRRRSARARGIYSQAEAVRVHASRLIIFQGTITAKNQIAAHIGWGDSIFNRVYAAVRDFVFGHESAATLLGDFAQAVYKIKGLAEMIARDEDDKVRNRAVLVDFMRSTARAILVDSEEDFERKSTSVDGLPEILDRLGLIVAAITDMPLTVLLGQSPAGLNATGESDIRNWYDHLESEREDKLREPLEELTRVMFLAKDGPTGGVEPEAWTLVFPPLWQMTDEQKAALRKTVAEADAIYVNAGVLMPEEVAESRFGGDEWSMETQIDDEIRAAYEAEEEEQAQLEAEAAKAQAEALAKGGLPPAPPGQKPGAFPPKPAAKKPAAPFQK